jgi:methionyl-tRNA synthetase
MELPWDPSQRMYVWFDALLNYYTALGFAREGRTSPTATGRRPCT